MTDIEVQTTVARIDDTLQDMHHRLFGNGQPGELSKQDDRIKIVEQFVYMAKGALALISLIVGLLAVDVVWKH